MLIVYIIAGIIVVCSVIFTIINYKYWKYISKSEIEHYKTVRYNEEKERAHQKIQDELKDDHNKLLLLESEIQQKIEFNNSLLKIREEELDKLIQEKKKIKITELEAEVDEWAQSAQEAANFRARQEQEQYQLQIDNLSVSCSKLQKELDNYKAKRDVINQEILRARAIEEKQDFYRVQLDDNSKSDIEVLNNIRQRLNKTDLLNKLIYENYIARPAKEMIKRVLGGKNPSGIYKVTNTKTNEIYIGKSAKIADRFSNHIKSAYGLEGVAESQFQRALKKYGIDMFTWELLEECQKENLSEREKYYIVFYGTKEYGYNQREG